MKERVSIASDDDLAPHPSLPVSDVAPDGPSEDAIGDGPIIIPVNEDTGSRSCSSGLTIVLSACVEGGSAACCLLRREGVAFACMTRYPGELWRELLGERLVGREKGELKCRSSMVVHTCDVARNS